MSLIDLIAINMSKNNITDLTKAFQNFTGIIEKFQKTHIEIYLYLIRLPKKSQDLKKRMLLVKII